MPFMMMDDTFVTSMWNPMVTAESVLPPLAASADCIDFGVTTIDDPLQPNMRFSARTLTLGNSCPFTVYVCVDNSAFTKRRRLC
jgi:hypothetical protein